MHPTLGFEILAASLLLGLAGVFYGTARFLLFSRNLLSVGAGFISSVLAAAGLGAGFTCICAQLEHMYRWQVEPTGYLTILAALYAIASLLFIALAIGLVLRAAYLAISRPASAAF
jgi:hypothetical protein